MDMTSFFSRIAKPVPVAAVVVVFLFGGTALAAERSLPKEMLYVVKTRINEPFRASFLKDAKTKATFHVSLADRRLREAEKLQDTGKLDEETKTELMNAFQNEKQKVQGNIDELNEKQNDSATQEITLLLKNMLEEHRGMVEKFNAETPATNMVGGSPEIERNDISSTNTEKTIKAPPFIHKDDDEERDDVFSSGTRKNPGFDDEEEELE